MPKGDLQTFGKRTFNVQHAAAAVLARKGNDWCPITLLQWYGRQTVVMPLGNQTGDLRTAAAGGALQIHSQHTTLSFAPLGKVEALEYPTDVFIAVAVVPVRCKRDLLAGAEKLFDLLNRAQPCFVHVDHHPFDDQPTSQFSLEFIA